MSFREVFRTSDPVRADMLEALLKSESIIFRRVGGPGPALGTLLHDHRFEVETNDYARAQALVVAFEGAQSVDARGDLASDESPSTGLRRLAPLLVRIWLFVFGGFVLTLPLLWLLRTARAAGVPSVALLSPRDVLALNMLGGLSLAFVRDRRARNRATQIFVAIVLAVSMFGVSR